MTKKYHKQYELVRDTPTHKAGWPLRWDGSRRKYFLPKASTWGYNAGEPDIYLDYDGQSFTIEDVEGKPDWFKPVDEATDYVPPFPGKEDIGEYVDLSLSTKLVDDVDVCRALNDLFRDEEFKRDLYAFAKYKYAQFHMIEGDV